MLAFMAAGIALSHSRHMMDLVPFILQDECSRTRSEVQGKYISIIFDGTTRLGEVLVVVLRYIEAWEIHQRLVRVDFLQKSLNAEELARQIVGVESGNLIAVMRDGASVNAAATYAHSQNYVS